MPRISLDSPRWDMPDTWTPPPTRLYVAPDSWVDVGHLSRVIAARSLRPFAPLSHEDC